MVNESQYKDKLNDKNVILLLTWPLEACTFQVHLASF